MSWQIAIEYDMISVLGGLSGPFFVMVLWMKENEAYEWDIKNFERAQKLQKIPG